MKYKLKRSELTYLVAYIRHIELSLHRREDLKDVKFKGYFSSVEEDIERVLSFKKETLPKVFSFFEKYFIRQEEYVQINELLDSFKNYVEKLDSNNEELMNLRINLNKINTKLSRRLKISDRKKINKIEHYNQNSILDTVNLKSFQTK